MSVRFEWATRCGRVMAIGLAMMAVGGLQAQSEDLPGRVRGLNGSILQLHGQTRRGGAPTALRVEAGQILRERAIALRKLMETDPAQAVALSLSREAVAEIASAFPDAAEALENPGEWEGIFEHIVFDDINLNEHHSLRQLKVGDEALDLYMAVDEPEGLQSGLSLRVSGFRLGNKVAAASAQVTATAGAACTTSGPQNTAVLLVTFPGVASPVSASTLASEFFSTSGKSLDGYWREASYGKTSAAGSVFGPYTLPTAYTCDQIGSILNAAILAADADVYFPNYQRIFVVFPNIATCSYGGTSTVGCSTVTSPTDGTSPASISWLIANYMGPTVQAVEIASHEGGHQLGLMHSRSRDFGADAVGALGVQGTVSDYGDNFSNMGYYNLGHYAAPQKAQLGWLTNIQTVQNNGSYTLLPLELNTSGVQALKVQRGTGNNSWLWMEYRQPIGNYDSTLPSQIFSGATIHYQDSYTGSYTDILDFTPQTTSWSDPALANGGTWADPYSNVSINLQGASASGTTVNVNYGAVPCTRGTPAVSASPVNPSTYAGNSVGYTVTVTNTDSSGCPGSTFNLSSAQPSGWVTGFSTTSLILSPGQTGSVTMTKTVPAGTSASTYPVNASASASMTGSGNANCTVMATPTPITVGTTVSGGPFSQKSTVPISAVVLSGSSPVAGATVTFTVRASNGGTTAATAITGSTGGASYSYKVNPKAVSGTYTVTASATYGGQTASSATITFTVQ